MRKPFMLLLYSMIYIAGVTVLIWHMSERPAERFAIVAAFAVALGAISFAVGSLVLLLADWLR